MVQIVKTNTLTPVSVTNENGSWHAERDHQNSVIVLSEYTVKDEPYKGWQQNKRFDWVFILHLHLQWEVKGQKDGIFEACK